MSAAAWSGTIEPLLIQSDASRLLVQELRRYRDRQVTGRSFLIAGHRGSGKTTLVQDAFLRIHNESVRLRTPNRLLLIPLHGPSLLPPEEDKNAGTAHRADADAAPPPTESDTQRVLKQITLALYRAIARESAACYRARVLEPSLVAGPLRQSELLEVAAQMEMELYDCPSRARLRQFWAHGGFLRTGVFHRGNERPDDQGLLELIAISSACEAYRRVAGTYSRAHGSKGSDTGEKASSQSVDTTGKNIVAPLVSVALGGAAAAAVFQDGGLVAAGLGGLLAAFGSSLVFKHSSSRTTSSTNTSDETFVFDMSVATLDRVLPILCERLALSGMMPVFVVDELDKVEDLSGRMGSMVRHLKKFVAESAFFCFLTDRTYLEEVRLRTEHTAHPAEQTYFRHPLMVVFTARDFHSYLGKVLEQPRPPPAASSSSTAITAEQRIADERLKQAFREDELDYPLLSYVLLHRARMHAGALHSELAKVTNANGELALAPGTVRSALACRLDVLVQVAIERVLDDLQLREILDREPERRMLVHDALYYPSYQWTGGSVEIDLGEGGREAFRKYLNERIGSKNHEGISASSETELLRYVREVADFIADPVSLGEELLNTGVPHSVQSGVLMGEKILPVLRKLSNGKYRWRYWHTGQRVEEPIPASGAEQAPTLVLTETSSDRQGPPSPVEDLDALYEQCLLEAEFIERFADALTSLFEGEINILVLSTQFRVLKTSPAWPEAQAAIGRLLNRRGRSAYTGYMQDLTTVTEFGAMLRAGMARVGPALISGTFIGAASKAKELGQRTYLGLKGISDTYHFSQSSEQDVIESLSRAGALLAPHFVGNQASGSYPWGFDAVVDVDEFATRLRELLAVAASVRLQETDLIKAQRESWSAWDTRLRRNILAPVTPSLADLYCAAASIRPANLLKTNLSLMTARAWSEALFWSIAGVEPTDPGYCPSWLSAPALRVLRIAVKDVRVLQMLVSRREGVASGSVAASSAMNEASLLSQGPCALVLIRDRGSLTANWMPPERDGAALLTADEVERLLKIDELKDLLGISTVVVEEGVPREKRNELVDKVQQLARAVDADLSYWLLCEKAGPDPLPQIVNPRSIEEMWQTIWSRPS